ncbi:uncharacterized protein BDW43DRAFT_296361 [Aspergillus alliaceus]|uniref:uncharacterized protein n=1 Tax=Petromyces alliaceus TaxID=209559 RepID=UPI0012A4C8D1|nr:uncharacterized protein BDW43DRAFT_296361 [Aspergillus alliaceus]KAB8238988.1 hypothetical protein BDW43DRAFT_296361 [Aspergillus alliaceus]
MASYAHASDNVSVITMIKGDEYTPNIFLLRMLFAREYDIGCPWQSSAQWAIKKLFSTLSKKLMVMTGIDDLLEKLAIQDSVTQFVASNREVSLGDVKEGLVDMLLQLKQRTATDNDININYPIVAVPDFFNQTLCDMVMDASKDPGIRMAVRPAPRTIMSSFTTTSTLTDPPGLNSLVLDHGMFYLDLRTMHDGGKKEQDCTKNHLFPILRYGSSYIDRKITNRLVDRVEELNVEIVIGASQMDSGSPNDDQCRYLDEYPLCLNGWGSGNTRAVLSWEEDRLRKTIRLPEAASNIETPETIGRVLLLTLREVLGERIEIVGGSKKDFSLAAFGAARGALAQKISGKICRRRNGKSDVLDHEL